MKKWKIEVPCYHGRGGFERGEWLRLALSGICLLLVILCTLLPGVRFSAYLFACLLPLPMLGVLLGRLSRTNRAAWIVRRIFRGCLLLGLAVFIAAEGLVLWHSSGDTGAQKPAAVIVLGAGVNGTTPSLVLRSRIDAVEAYMEEYPDIPVILSGGQGAGEQITEAEAMRRAITMDGGDAARLILEEQSTTTAENFSYSKAQLIRNGIDPATDTVAVVTNGFHLYRAGLQAGEQGFEHVLRIPAELPWWLAVNYDVREVFALGKMLLT